MKYSPTANGFFIPAIHGDAIPADAVEITEAEHAALLDAQAQGATIQPGPGGRPIAVTTTPPTPEELLQAERASMVVSRFQARAALHIAGLLAQVELAVAAADPLTQMAWADAQEFRRGSPTIAALAGAVDLTPEQIDDLFRQAAQIEA